MIGAVFLLGLVGCVNPLRENPRIAANQALFDQMPPDVQRSIRAEQVLAGFSEAAALLAWGEPFVRGTLTNAEGTFDLWTYRLVLLSGAHRRHHEYRHLLFRDGKVAKVQFGPR